mmetsp:Transcript_7880/g.16457  ORF Transcript_7880/g.16457 Transcript_7880/m.16457 type:complete len:380 (-) Transcript_7880:43-1182(-)
MASVHKARRPPRPRNLVFSPLFITLFSSILMILLYSTSKLSTASISDASSTLLNLRGIGADIYNSKAVALPSVRINSQESKIKRSFYGGAGDKAHLGGFTDLDLMGISPSVWRTMIQFVGVKSLVDLGCGKGVSASWFWKHGVDVTCAEGSHDAVEQSLLPKEMVVEHDFTRGAWWPDQTVDAVWCVEFSEHVQRQYIQNYATVLKKAAVVFVSHSNWGGWHHAEVHDDRWWKLKYESFGLLYSDDLTELIRKKAQQEQKRQIRVPVNKEDGEPEYYNAQHIWTSMMVFLNPTVAGLPSHQHLFAEPGCYGGKGEEEWFSKKKQIHYPCGEEKPDGKMAKDMAAEPARLPDEYKPLVLTDEMQEEWERLVFKKTAREMS